METGWNGPGVRGGGRTSQVVRVVGALRGDPRGVTMSYAGLACSSGAPDSQPPQRFPADGEMFSTISIFVLAGPFSAPVQIQLISELEETPLVLTVPAGAAIGYRDTITLRRPVRVGRDFDVRLSGCGEGALTVNIALR